MSDLVQNIGKRKIIVFSIIGIVLLALLGYAIYIAATKDTGQPSKLDGYSKLAADAPGGLEPMVEGGVMSILRKNNPESVNVSKLKPVVREGSYKKIPANSDGIVQVQFFVDIEAVRQSYAVYMSYYADDSNGKFAGPPTVRCITNEKDYIYEKFDCKNIIEGDNRAAEDPLLSKLPYTDPYYFISGYIDSNNVKHVTVDIDLNANSDVTKRMFQQRKEKSLEWIKSTGANPDDYLIQWRNLRKAVIEQNSAGD